MTPTPELGQPVWIAAVARCDEDGVTLVLSPVLVGGVLASSRFDLPPTAVVWHPADVPPQPPMLDDDAVLALIRRGINDPGSVLPRETFGTGDGTGAYDEGVGAWGARAVYRLLAEARLLADVPGPDDTTPERSYYFASRYSRHPEMRAYRDELAAAIPGAIVTSRWIDLHGGELVSSYEPETLAAQPAQCWPTGVHDLEDLDAAATIVSFTGPGGKGGRHVEHGYAMAAGKRLVVIGPRENVFHCHPRTEVFETWADFLAAERRPDDSTPTPEPNRICACCSGRGDHRCGHECSACDGSGVDPDSPCRVPHGADCGCDRQPADVPPQPPPPDAEGIAWVPLADLQAEQREHERLVSDLAAALDRDDWERTSDLTDQVRALRLAGERAADVPPQPPVLAWSLPDEPAPEVTALRCRCHGIRWERTKLASAGGETLWEQEGRTAGMEWAVWRYLLAEHTLNDATTEETA